MKAQLNKRSRTWNITYKLPYNEYTGNYEDNIGLDIYGVEYKIQNTKGLQNYFLIEHNQDTMTQEDIENAKDKLTTEWHVGDKKTPHFHAVLWFNNKKSFSQMQKLFPYCHIEPTNSISASIQYLIHKGFDEKHQYSKEEIITNNQSLLDYHISRDIELFDENQIIQYIIQGTTTITLFYERFGSAINPYMNMIKSILREQGL
jgi:hypothetical protein